MKTMQIYAIINGELCTYSDFKNREEANKSFLEVKENAELLATNNNGKIKFWIGDETDWLIPMIEANIEADDWRHEDDFEFRILSQWAENALVEKVNPLSRDCEEEWKVHFRGKTYRLTSEYCREDCQWADMYGSRDKYYRYTFWDKDGNDLSCYCVEC